MCVFVPAHVHSPTELPVWTGWKQWCGRCADEVNGIHQKELKEVMVLLCELVRPRVLDRGMAARDWRWDWSVSSSGFEGNEAFKRLQ
ncbi:unnamed protein product [Protopolystoma xenopodis]|uniref:Uncharacterized protein n=1 Tax=Protopolystoma xenopodis TaxID=117903 RepID=A0A3S5FFD0_9PLAT|nr:unnamed protein product [Protopolystoma xenopodis]